MKTDDLGPAWAVSLATLDDQALHPVAPAPGALARLASVAGPNPLADCKTSARLEPRPLNRDERISTRRSELSTSARQEVSWRLRADKGNIIASDGGQGTRTTLIAGDGDRIIGGAYKGAEGFRAPLKK